MLFAFLVIYFVVSLVAVSLFYVACAIGTRIERVETQEIHFDKRDLDFHFNHLEWAEKANG